MSADLLAEFGPPQHTSSANARKSQHITESDPASDTLLPNLEFNRPRPKGSAQLHKHHEEPLWSQGKDGADVLFDASEAGDDKEDEDDFGDFETVEPSNTSSRRMNELQPTLSLGRSNMVSESRETSLNDEDWGTFEDGVQGLPQAVLVPIKTPTLSQLAQGPNPGAEDEGDDGWTAFDDEADDRRDERAASSTDIEPGSSNWSTIPAQSSEFVSTRPISASESVSAVRPTNIPPPALLLQILPAVFTRLRKTVDDSSSPVQTLASNIIQAYAVATRVIAGKSYRWKRDNVLAQSTKIGPAGKPGGMKLTSLDKTESMKEEREASDAINAWSGNAHVFGTILSKAHVSRRITTLPSKVIPKAIRENGVLSANRACALCGLRREERLPTVDIDVSDAFGEFWTEHWGHAECHDFWETYRELLHQR